MRYPIIVQKEPKSCYGVIVPDLAGCFSAGNSYSEAIRNTRVAMKLFMDIMKEEGKAVSAPSPIEKFLHAPEFSDAFAIVYI